jgi:putative ABC transport system permease protein
MEKPAEAGVVSPSGNFFAITPGYLRAMGIPLLKGRDFTAADSSTGAPVALISKTVADRLLPGVDPLGHRMHVTQGPGQIFAEIVGVVGDVKTYGLDREDTLEVYEPVRQHAYFGSLTMIVRTSLGPDATATAVRGVLKDMDPNLPIANVRTVQSIVDASVGDQKFTALLLGVFSVPALILAAIGVYGLVSFTVGQRSKEIGIRAAPGARASSVITGVMAQGLGLTMIGVLLGGMLSFWATRLLQSELFQVTAHDPVAFSIAPVVLMVAAALACVLPALRALKVDPATALRE